MIVINNIEVDKKQLLQLINKNRKIQAIKLIKDQTGLGLKECKDIVDNLSDDSTFYDSKTYISKSDDVEIAQKPLRQGNYRGSHIIKTEGTRTNNYIILALLICVILLSYLYIMK